MLDNSNPIPISDAGGSVTVDGTVAVSGTVTVGSHAVTNAGTFATQVDGAALTALQLIDNLVLAEDAVHNSGDPGVMALFVRQNSQVDLAADGDYIPATIADDGGLRVNITNGAAGGTSEIDDAAFTAATDSGTPIMGFATSDAVDSGDVGVVAMTTARAMHVHVASYATSQTDDAAFTPGTSLVSVVGAEFDDTAPDSVDEGDAGALRMSGNRNLYVTLRDAAGNERGLNVNASGEIGVASHAVTNAGTFAVQAASAGIAADDAATSGNPVLVAGVAVETDGTDPTTVSAEGDAAYLRTDRVRRLLVSEHHPRSFQVSADYGAAQTNTSVQAAPGAGLSLYITDIVISNGAVAGNITLLDGSGGTVLFEIYPAINGGVATSRRQPIRLTANTALVITSTTVTTHSVNIGGYIAP